MNSSQDVEFVDIFIISDKDLLLPSAGTKVVWT
jgi:hypothetical protein